ncbi:MAG: glycosyltransferase family 39 protein [Bacteroidota bacterium]
MIKLQQIVYNKWFLPLFFCLAISISVFQHYRVFSLDVIGYHAWRQTQTQTVIENFANEDFNILNPRINDFYYKDRLFRMEFPLAQWIIAALYKLLGNHLIITRLFFYLATLFSVWGIYKVIQALTRNKLVACLTSWFFLFSPIIYYYSVNPLPDNLALCLGIWSVYYWIKHLKEDKMKFFVISILFLAFSLAVKLPFIVFGIMYVSKVYERGREKKIDVKYILLPALICSLPLLWYVFIISTWRENGIIGGIFSSDFPLLKLLDIFQFNLISTLPELLVNYATVPLFIIGLYFVFRSFNFRDTVHRSLFYVLCACSFYFLYEMNMIDKVHDYYLFVFLPFIFIIISKAILIILSKPANGLKYLILLSFMVSPITAYLRCNTRWNAYSPGFTKEYLFYKKDLQAIIPKDAKVIVHGDASRCIVLYHLNRKGWSDSEEGLTKDKVDNAIKNGATYLVSDTGTDISKFIDMNSVYLIFQKNALKLYKIK